MAHQGIAETRRLVWALRPSALEHGTLVETLQAAVDRWRAGTSTRASLTVTGTPRPLHPDVEVTLLRSAQEALANAARHASAREVTLTLSYLGDVVTLDIHDDGVGFDPAAAPRPPDGRGLGLVGMRERAERLGGTLAVESVPGEGTTLGVTLPALAPA
jgi:signal transduction histidine kinase